MTSTDALEHLAGRPLLRSMAQHWWLMLLRGVAAIAFGILSLIWPGISALTLVLLWGAYTFADGILALAAAIMGKGAAASSRWWLAFTGVLGIAAGLIAFFAPGLTGSILLIFIAVWAIAIGVMAIVGAVRLRQEIEGEWLLILSGAIAIVFGVLMLFQPIAGALTVIWLIAAFAIIFGIDLIWFALKLKGIKDRA
jgi:uncharacterized membrane protein HdeD (DUF308 family)